MNRKDYPLVFSHSRTALKYGLLSVELPANCRILVPEYTCDALVQPLDDLGISPVYYPTFNNFTPDWTSLHQLVQKGCHAIIMIHYFGQPQDISRFQEFASSYNLYLIDDNAHGYGGLIGDQELGTFGDIGISAPRKILSLKTGGLLYLNRPSLNIIDEGLLDYPKWRVANIISKGLSKLPNLQRAVRVLGTKTKDISNPTSFRDFPVGDWIAMTNDIEAILENDWKSTRRQRLQNWDSWTSFIQKMDLNPVWANPEDRTCPWALPVYCIDLEDRNRWLRWGRKRHLDFFTWPSLPSSTIEIDGESVERWKRLFCISLSDSVPDDI